MDDINYYELLGVLETASITEIRTAYKNQIKKWHPDINHSEDSTFMTAKLNEAREVLLDKEKRIAYDEYLKNQRTENYEKHFKKKSDSKESTNTTKKENNTEYQEMTKWDYLWEWLRVGNASLIRKIIGLFGVLLESIFCTILTLLLILFSYLTSLGGWILEVCSRILFWFLGILTLLFLFSLLNDRMSTLESVGMSELVTIGVTLGVFFLSTLLYRFSEFIISVKVFTFLYQKININLFKICVGYNK